MTASRWLVLAVLVASVVVVMLTVSQTRTYVCDGAFPVWMLEAQDYDNGGCAYVLPSDQAPPDADWRIQCTGVCLDSPDPNATIVAEFNIAFAKVSFVDECTDPVVVDDQFCGDVVTAGMTAEGSILDVPTRLDPQETERAADVCRMIARFRYDNSAGRDLGYANVEIYDLNGDIVGACVVRQ